VKKHFFSALAVAMMLSVSHTGRASAQTTYPTVYLESKDEFANDFSAGVIRKAVPVTLTADLRQAGYIARFTWSTNEGSKTQGVMTALMTGMYMNGSYERVSMSIMERESKNLIYSYTCQKGGRHVQSVAECLAKHWKESFANGPSKMPEFSASELAGIHDQEAETVSVRKAGDTLSAVVTEHPEPTLMVVPGGSAVPEATESVAEASRRMKAEKASQKAAPQSP
jgi:hypothetical protein